MWKKGNCIVPVARLHRQTGAATCGKQYCGSSNVKNRIILWSSNHTIGYLSQNTKTLIKGDTCTFMLIAGLFMIAELWKKPTSKCLSINEWMKKVSFIYTIEYHLAVTQNEVFPFSITWMELEVMMLREINQRKTWFHSYVEFKKQNKTKTGKGKDRERETKKHIFNYREQTDGYQRGVGGEMNEIGDRD